MKTFQKYLSLSVILVLLVTGSCKPVPAAADISDYISFVILSDYSLTMDIGASYRLSAVTSTLKKASWKSSDSKIVSVSTTGVVKAKKAGTATVTAKISNAEAVCIVTVLETVIDISQTSVSMENGQTFKLDAVTSNGSAVKWKSSSKSIASVDTDGLVTARKPGTVTITASADGSSQSCQVTIVKPNLTLSSKKLSLYRCGTARLRCRSSSGLPVTWKSSKPSVASVDDDGLITAVKHGSATITASLDGVSVTCTVTVRQPDITLSETSLTLTKGQTRSLTASVSSGNKPEWSSSNTAIADVDEEGNVTAVDTGKAYIYVSEDGVKKRCTVRVT